MSYPEHEKLQKIKNESQTVGEFLEWLTDYEKIILCRWQDEFHNGEPLWINRFGEPCSGMNADAIINPKQIYIAEGFYPAKEQVINLLAKFFQIDQEKLEAEKRAMLDELRATHT